MSFAIRATYKSRMPASTNTSTTGDDNLPDREETQEVIDTMRRFSQRSSHENTMTVAELQNIISKSSLNPDINPSARKGVEAMLKAVAARQTPEDPQSKDLENSHGFSTGSVNKFNTNVQSAKMGRALKRELDAIKERRHKGDTDARDIPDDIARQISAMKGEQKNDDDDIPSSDEDEQNEDQEEEKKNEISEEAKQKRASIEKAKRVLAMGYPKTASMARGFVHRNGGSSGHSIKRTAMGLMDGF